MQAPCPFQHFLILSPLYLFQIHRNLWITEIYMVSQSTSCPSVSVHTLTEWPRLGREHRSREGGTFPKSYNHYTVFHMSQITTTIHFVTTVVCVCVCGVCMSMERLKVNVRFLPHHSPHFLTQGLFTKPGVYQLARVVSQWTLGSSCRCPSRPIMKLQMQAITPASPLPTEPSPLLGMINLYKCMNNWCFYLMGLRRSLEISKS